MVEKIDMILKCSSNVKVDKSTNEWKRALVKLRQQSKNHHLNTANLFSLNIKFGLESAVALDFVGNSGYLYLLHLVKDGPGLEIYVTVAHLFNDLVIPTTIELLDTVKDTLCDLLTLKVTNKRKICLDRIMLSVLLGKSNRNSINLNILLLWRTFAQHHRPVYPTPSYPLYFLH